MSRQRAKNRGGKVVPDEDGYPMEINVDLAPGVLKSVRSHRRRFFENPSTGRHQPMTPKRSELRCPMVERAKEGIRRAHAERAGWESQKGSNEAGHL
jgi:hypothetical protein